MQGIGQLLAFAETAKHGSFAAAARQIGGTPSTLAKAVGRLELGLGVKLFHRTTRQVKLTPDGERLFQRCQRVLEEMENLQADAAGTQAAPSGTLRVDAPIFYGRRFVLPVLAELAQRYPALTMDVRLSDGFGDFVRDQIDLAVRIGPLRDSTLVARRVDWQGLVLCASPAYLAAHGTPRQLEDLATHAAVAFRLPSSGRSRPWQFRQRGKPLELQPQARVRVSDTEGLAQAVRLGLGVGQVPDNVVADELACGALVELLSSCRPAPMPISVVVPSARLMPARVRAAIDALLGLRRKG